jgi:hypothetical protein
VLLIDPLYDQPSSEAIRLSLAGDQFSEVALSEHRLHTAVACQSGIGDGIYPVHVRLAPSPLDGRPVVAELRVIFLDG